MIFNLAFWLSIVLAASSCFGLLLAGRGKWQGWAVGLATQPVWAWFALVTKSYGLLLVGVMYTSVYAKNLWKWKKDTKRHQARDLFVNAMESGVMSPNEVRRVINKGDSRA